MQIACPRLSIDWGGYFAKPLLTTYEFYVLLEKTDWKKGLHIYLFNIYIISQFSSNFFLVYPMDYYSNEGGEWSSYYHRQKDASKKKKQHIGLQFEESLEKK